MKNYIHNFDFLIEKYEYSITNIYDNSDNQRKYSNAIVYSNTNSSNSISIIYYNNNPLNDNKNEVAYQVIFQNKDKKRFDLSRYNKSKEFLLKYCKYQYFIVEKSKQEEFIIKLVHFLKNECSEIISGNLWVDIIYDLRDDY